MNIKLRTLPTLFLLLLSTTNLVQQKQGNILTICKKFERNEINLKDNIINIYYLSTGLNPDNSTLKEKEEFWWDNNNFLINNLFSETGCPIVGINADDSTKVRTYNLLIIREILKNNFDYKNNCLLSILKNYNGSNIKNIIREIFLVSNGKNPTDSDFIYWVEKVWINDINRELSENKFYNTNIPIIPKNNASRIKILTLLIIRSQISKSSERLNINFGYKYPLTILALSSITITYISWERRKI